MRTKKLFAFRVDSSRKIGSGHLMRCLTLAGGLSAAGSVCSFICRALEGNLNHVVLSEGFELIELPNHGEYSNHSSEREPYHSDWREVDLQTDAAETLDVLSNLDPDWLIVDHYGLWQDWELTMTRCDIKIMVIDDLGDRKHHCDLLLDQNLGSDQLGYSELIPRSCKTLYGPDYAILRPEFNEYRKKSLARRQGKKINNILINFGGGDPDNYIAKSLSALLDAKIPEDIMISIIFGGLSAVEQEHKELMSKFSNKIKSYGLVRNMAEMLTDSDLVIGAAGSSAWERCCLGVPSIVFPVALNQLSIAANLSDCGASIALSDQDLMNGKLGLLVTDLLHSEELIKMSKMAANICDGSGLGKIISELNA